MNKRARKNAEATDPQSASLPEGTGVPHAPADPFSGVEISEFDSQPQSPDTTGPAASHSSGPPSQPTLPKIPETLPSVRSIDHISLSDSRDGPEMRLLRSHRPREIWIQFDENPGKPITEQLKAVGFRWEYDAEYNDKKGAWVKPLDKGYELATMLDAERLFKDLGNEIRQGKGLQPAGVSGHTPA